MKIKFFQTIFIFILSIFLVLELAFTHNKILASSEIQEIKLLQQQSQENYQKGNFYESEAALNRLIQIFSDRGNIELENLAITWTNLGQLQLAWGQSENALESWQKAVKIYRQLQRKNEITRLEIYQVQALKNLGLYSQACSNLTKILEIPEQLCQSDINYRKIIDEKIDLYISSQGQDISLNNLLDGFQHLGDFLYRVGRLKESKNLLEYLIQKASQLPNDNHLDALYLGLGNTLRAMGNLERDRQGEPKYNYIPWQCEHLLLPQKAQDYYQQALEKYQLAAEDSSKSIQIKAKLNQLNLLIDLEDFTQGEILSQQIQFNQLPVHYSSLYAKVNYAKNLACLEQQKKVPSWNRVIELLETSVKEAQSFEEFDNLASRKKAKVLTSYATGSLASFYEYLGWQSQQYSSQNRQTYQQKAYQLTEEALYLAQPNEAPDLAYQWLWQLGRILEAQGNGEEAINSYQQAVKTLETVRTDLLTVNTDIQFSFRDNVEPVYRELINLLASSLKTTSLDSDVKIKKILYYIESLQLAELQNFLKCDLVDVSQKLKQPIPQVINQNTVLLYPIILKDKIMIISQRSGQEPQYYIHENLPYQQVEKTLKDLQKHLKEPSRTKVIQADSSQLYDWIIRPFEKELESEISQDKSQIRSLVFVLDGSLRNIPMGVLYDRQRQHYLIERYAIALTPGLQLLKAAKPSHLSSALLGGLSQEYTVNEKRYSALPNILGELSAIQSVIPSVELINENFTRVNLRKQLNSDSFSIIHLATHGQFSSDPEETFLILSDGQIKAEELNNLLQDETAIDLLVLSACETATGDRRAVLGLAGVSVRSGVNSTLATLWQVNDRSTAQLMSQFYHYLNLNPKMTKAEALRQAQLELWNYQEADWEDPFFWASYILVGN